MHGWASLNGQSCSSRRGFGYRGRMRMIVVVSLLSLSVACGGIARDPSCAAADSCDQSLAEPFNSFSATNPQFGDTGSCWQNDGTAAPCIEACTDFVAQQANQAKAANNRAVIAACGG
jgi:hypothetical protein